MGLLLFVGLVGWQVAATPARGNPHRAAAICLGMYAIIEMSESCWQVCINCHAPTRPIVPLDIYLEGDAVICSQCHENEAMAGGGGNSFLLYRVGGGGGNHPVNIAYLAESFRSGLRPEPRPGPRLFFSAAGVDPRVHCSSCHNPMGRSPQLLWISNTGSALCIACHDK